MAEHGAHDFVAGTIGGLAGLVAGHPLDTVRVRMQAQSGVSVYHTTYDCVIATLRRENVPRFCFIVLTF